jgi:hypothetical protein
MIRRMIFWNEHNFFRKVERRTGKEIIAAYPPESPQEIYERDYWWSDAWSPLSYGRGVDWNKPFLQQIHELELAVPMPARSMLRSVNSDYSNEAADVKNCYLCFNADQCEDCMYGIGMLQMKNSLDVFRATTSELIYDSFGAFNSYQCFFGAVLTNCRNVWLSYNCEDCSNCFGCVNLRHGQYQIFNKQYTKEEYFAKLKEMNLGSHAALESLKQQFKGHMLKYPRKYMTGVKNQNVTGDYIKNSKNTKDSYSGVNCENVRFSQSILMGAKDTYDYTNWGNNVEMTYETQSVGENAQRIKFSYQCFNGVNDIEYSIYCPGSSNLFGCVGLNKKQYCILNKQYSKEEYDSLVPKIKEHMEKVPYVDAKGRIYKYGEFFPPEFAPYAVNDTVVMDFMNIDKEKAEQYGLRWREENPKDYQITRTAEELPDSISETKDDITKEVIGCSKCGRGYRILQTELEFLRRFDIPLPRNCFNCRHTRRVNLRNKPRWYDGSCQCAGTQDKKGAYVNTTSHFHDDTQCPNTFRTSYAPGQPEIVYCEQCYQKEVYD